MFTLNNREKMILIVSLFALILYALIDPDVGLIKDLAWGGAIIVLLSTLAKSFLGAALFHYIKTVLMPYVKFIDLYKKAKETPEGAGLFAIGAAVFLYAIMSVVTSVLALA